MQNAADQQRGLVALAALLCRLLPQGLQQRHQQFVRRGPERHELARDRSGSSDRATYQLSDRLRETDRRLVTEHQVHLFDGFLASLTAGARPNVHASSATGLIAGLVARSSAS